MAMMALLNEAIRLLQECGYTIRQEWLDGSGGGACAVKGQKLFFLDLALSPQEQLELILNTLREECGVSQLRVSPSLANLLKYPKSASFRFPAPFPTQNVFTKTFLPESSTQSEESER